MKLAVCLLAAPVAGLVAPAAPARTATVLNAEMSKALPFLTAPKGLKGYIGEEAGFDPVGFAEIMDIKWMREAEIKHGRVAMLATIGYTYPEMPWFAQAFPGDAYSHSNPIKAALAVPRGVGAGPPLLRRDGMERQRRCVIDASQRFSLIHRALILHVDTSIRAGTRHRFAAESYAWSLNARQYDDDDDVREEQPPAGRLRLGPHGPHVAGQRGAHEDAGAAARPPGHDRDWRHDPRLLRDGHGCVRRRELDDVGKLTFGAVGAPKKI